jgi:hypothetical protein
MPIDSSIYSNIKGPAPLDIGALINQARSAQQLQGESSLGDIYKQATDPVTGEVNAGKLGTLAPSAGVLAPAVAAQAQERQQGQQTIDRTKLDNIRQWWQTLDSELYSHMNDPDLNHKKVLDSIHGLIGHKTSELNGGIFTPQLATQASSWLWGPDGKPLPPDKIRQTLGQFHQRVQGNLQSSEYVPAGIGPNGEQLFMTRNGLIARDAARGGAAAGAGGRSGAPAAPGPPGVGGGARMQPGGGVAVPASLPPGVATRQEGAAATDVRLADSLAHEAEGSQQRRALLGNIMDLSDKFTPGPGAHESAVAKNFINRNIPLPEGWKFDQKSIANQEEFAKQAAQFAQKQFDTIGGTGTDAKFNSAFTVSPNEALSGMGIKGISRLLLGNEDAIQAKNKAWLDASGADPNLSYRRFSQDFQSHFDPRVFQFKYVPSKERQEYFDKMEPQDQARLLHDMTYARKNGWVSYGEGSKAAPAGAAPAKPSSFDDRFNASKPPIPGVRPGRRLDGTQGWFMEDPGRPGKHMEVKLA